MRSAPLSPPAYVCSRGGRCVPTAGRRRPRLPPTMSQLVPDGRNGVATRGESRSWRVGFGATLALAMGISPVVLYSLNVLSPFVISDLGLSRTAFGSLASLSFAVAIPCSYFGGRAVDRIGGRRLLFGLVVTAIISVLLVARADAFGWLVGAAAVAGLSQSMANPVTNHLVSAFVRRGHQGMLMGVKQSGVQMSQFATGIALPPLALLIGWRGAMSSASGGRAMPVANWLICTPDCFTPISMPW